MMRRSRELFALLAVGSLAGIARLLGADVLSDLGVSEGRAREAVFDSFVSGAVSIVGNPSVFKHASPQVRVAIVKTATTLARSYVETDDFAKRYMDIREANAPDPLPPETTADEILAKQRREYEKQVAGLRAQFDVITPEQRAVLEQGFDEMRVRFEEMERDGRKAELEKSLKAQRTQILRVYEASVQRWERAYPKEPAALVAMRLRRFLDLTREIDYTAKLVERDRRMRFANETLENRPAEWKMCFRAGQAATDTARGMAQNWLSALEAKGVK